MKVLMFYETAPDGLPKAREHFPAHRARLAAFHERGVLLMAGPYGNPPVAALGIFTTREAAEEFVKDDPFVLHGVVARYYFQEWNEVLTGE
ncbi:YciI family protein [Polyangium sp. 6x1]|uniref:YciI family protein n=1 Tax=Polyangium sp. 6x1 TaxID=3042689 RepID=UPI00248266B7|nr:YciI family protein [Polyangium sp. 6x1]MDI1446779.1 YciI family protein [Polyangium sp. 6x1]